MSQFHTDVLLAHMEYHAKSNQAVLFSLESRISALNNYETSCKATQKKVVAIEKLKSSSNIKQDKVEAALDELTEVRFLYYSFEN
jgi:hypothetical protein